MLKLHASHTLHTSHALRCASTPALIRVRISQAAHRLRAVHVIVLVLPMTRTPHALRTLCTSHAMRTFSALHVLCTSLASLTVHTS